MNLTKEQEKEYKELLEKKAKQQATWQRNTARERVIIRKAKAAGITVSEAEIDEYLKTHKK